MPDWEAIALPLLTLASDGTERSLREVTENLASHFKLSDAQREELLPSGSQPRFANRVGWSRTALKKAGLLESPRHGYIRITGAGNDLLRTNPPKINTALLKQFPGFVAY
jgi:restriction system protein